MRPNKEQSRYNKMDRFWAVCEKPWLFTTKLARRLGRQWARYVLMNKGYVPIRWRQILEDLKQIPAGRNPPPMAVLMRRLGDREPSDE